MSTSGIVVGGRERNRFEGEDEEVSPPLFVRIQNIDLQSLDLQANAGSTIKFRNLTCIEATNIFLFMGSTSGTVYVLSRDTLKFLFIIPFKGGKICSIACSQDECDVAVGSIRGKVSIYRIFPNVHYMQLSAPLIDAYREIYDVPHHAGAEITELQWSRNGKYLFIGDSQGIVSQIDVACLDEFPRPVPSKVILKLQSRILQIDCFFPYLAVCTLNAVFLCDLEKEDFTRVQNINGTDIRSTGLCLMVLPERSSMRELIKERAIPSAVLVLFIGEVGTGTIHCCNMGGSIQYSKRIEISSNVSKYSMPLFDPTQGVDPHILNLEPENEEVESNSSFLGLGKLMCTDDGLIVSASSDRLNLYDPNSLNLIAWNTHDFKRINNFKIISNYAFIWAGNKLTVVAFTPFRSYGEQLFRAKLFQVLEKWTLHALYSLGWRRPIVSTAEMEKENKAERDTNEIQSQCSKEIHESSTSSLLKGNSNDEKILRNFRKMLYAEGDEDNEFTNFVARHAPIAPLTIAINQSEEELPEMSMKEESVGTPIERSLMTLLTELQSIFAPCAPLPDVPQHESAPGNFIDSSTCDKTDASRMQSENNINDGLQLLLQIWKSLLDFYEEIEVVLPQLDYKLSELTLSRVLHASHAFVTQPNLINIHEKTGQILDMPIFQDTLTQVLSCLSWQKHSANLGENAQISSHSSFFTLCFTKFAQCPLAVQWFRELDTSREKLFYDALLADTLLLLYPLTCHESEGFKLTSCLEAMGIYDRLSEYFMTWLVLCRFLYKPKEVPYSPVLRSLLNEQLFEQFAEEMFSTIYRDLALPNFRNAAQFLPHALSTIILLSKSSVSSEQPRNVSILLTCFPLKKWAPNDIVTQIITACHLNPTLLGLYLKACMEDGNSFKLCGCGIQAGYGSLENVIPPWQRAIEEAVIKLLLDKCFNSFSSKDRENAKMIKNMRSGTHTHRSETLVHMFAMRRGLLEPYFRSPLPDKFLSKEMQAEVIIRYGACTLLKNYECNQQNMSLLVGSYQRYSSKAFGNIMFSDKSVSRDQIKCFKCSHPLRIYKGFNPISRDCLGMWLLTQVSDVVKLRQIIQDCPLNTPGMFSLRLYRAVVQFTNATNVGGRIKYPETTKEIPSIPACASFH